MFRCTDDLNIDEDFLSDAFDIPSSNTSNESTKRNSDSLDDQPVKKICTTENSAKNILSIINSKPQAKFLDCLKTVASPNNNSLTNTNCLSSKNYLNQEKRRVVQRKFPGPAGILPEQKQISISTKTFEEFDTSANHDRVESDEIVCSQLSEDIFNTGPWLKMLTDWSTIYHNICLPDKYTISWLKSKAMSKKLLGQKTPFIAAVIQIVDCSSKDPMILLKDKTGDIQATLLHEVWEEYCDYLSPGSVIVLKQVGVLSTLKKHYLTITLNNMVAIYSEEENEETEKTVETTNIQNIDVEKLIETIRNAKQSFEAQKILQKLQPTTNNPYFKKPMNPPQKSPQILVNKFISNNEMMNNSICTRNENNLNQTSHRFNFKAKICTNKISDEFNNQKDTINRNENSEENIILTQTLDGVDTSSLFEDF